MVKKIVSLSQMSGYKAGKFANQGPGGIGVGGGAQRYQNQG